MHNDQIARPYRRSQCGVEGEGVGMVRQDCHHVDLAVFDGLLQDAAALHRLEASPPRQQVGLALGARHVDVAADSQQLRDEGVGDSRGAAVGDVGVEGLEDLAGLPCLLVGAEGALDAALRLLFVLGCRHAASLEQLLGVEVVAGRPELRGRSRRRYGRQGVDTPLGGQLLKPGPAGVHAHGRGGHSHVG